MLAIFGCVVNEQVSYVYTVSFDSMGGSDIDALEIEEQSPLEFVEALKEGHTLIGWYISDDEGETVKAMWDFDSDLVTESVTLYAKWEVNTYTITFRDEETVLYQETVDYNYDLSYLETFVPNKEGHVFIAWADEIPPLMPASHVTIYVVWDIQFSLVQVGEEDTDYLIPTGLDDEGRATVRGGYFMATTQTTYAFWFEVRLWAEANGYHFQNIGREGSTGDIGDMPTDASLKPVTSVSWRDVIVWLNAFSEKNGFEPVYRDGEGHVIKDARDDNAMVVDNAVVSDHNGYRLPSYNEWEMAARWKDDTETTDGSMLVGERYWTPGNYVSGATNDFNDGSATTEVAWIDVNAGGKAQPVGKLSSNHLGIYDMGGNVWEWTHSFNQTHHQPYVRGGSWLQHALFSQIAYDPYTNPANAFNYYGFRFLRNP